MSQREDAYARIHNALFGPDDFLLVDWQVALRVAVSREFTTAEEKITALTERVEAMAQRGELK